MAGRHQVFYFRGTDKEYREYRQNHQTLKIKRVKDLADAHMKGKMPWDPYVVGPSVSGATPSTVLRSDNT